MTNDSSGNDPTTKADEHSSPKSEGATTAPKQSKLGKKGKRDADEEKAVSTELAREFRWFEFFSLAINGALAIIGIFALCIYYGQLNAFIESNKINRDALTSVQRPFVNFSGINNDRLMLPNRPPLWQFTATIENSGTTPAITASSFVDADALSDEPDEQRFRGDSRPELFSSATIGPKAVMRIGVVHRDEVALFGRNFDVKNLRPNIPVAMHVYIWGYVIYKDVFLETKTHVTEFCQRLDSVSRSADLAQFQTTSANCKKYNCTDEYCENYADIVKLLPNKKN